MEDRYSISIFWSEEDDAYIALSPDFPGLSAFGSLPEEAAREAADVLAAMAESLREEGAQLPKPRFLPRHSGQLRIRIPKTLHMRLALEAERQGVSLNTLMTCFLEQGETRSDALQTIQAEMNDVKTMLQSVRSEIKALKDAQGKAEDAFSVGASMGATLAYKTLELQASYGPTNQPVSNVFLRR